MRRLEVRSGEQALGDPSEIWEYVAEKASPETSGSDVGRIVDACEAIGDAPEGGRPSFDLRAGLRSRAIPNRAVIPYAVAGGTVAISGVFHRGRSVDDHCRNAGRTLR